MSARKGILERLAAGPVVGDGSMIFTLERRGYAAAGPWTTEAAVRYPEAVLQLHREYVRSGADVVQTATFFSSDDRLSRDNGGKRTTFTCKEINDAACKLARKAADENGCLVCGGISPTSSFGKGLNEQVVAAEFKKQVDVYREHDVDFITSEFFDNIEEVEICAREMKKLNKPIALSMRIGPVGDVRGVSVEECAVRMAKTGADIIGTNCLYDVNAALNVIQRMKKALAKEDLQPYIVCQPLGIMCPEVENSQVGYLALREFPFAMEPRVMTRIEAHKYARRAYDLGVNYIGGCCMFEALHIRAISQELENERGIVAPVNEMNQAFGGEMLRESSVGTLSSGEKSTRQYWYNVNIGCGRPFNSTLTPMLDTKYVYTP